MTQAPARGSAGPGPDDAGRRPASTSTGGVEPTPAAARAPFRLQRRVLLAAGAALLVAGASWPTIARRWTDRIPPGWEWRADFVGISARPDPVTGAFPERD